MKEEYVQGNYKVTKTTTNITYCLDRRLMKDEPKPLYPTYQEPAKPEIIKPKFPPVICPYCQASIPANGGAQFAHLSKHVRELTHKQLLTEEQAKLIKSTKLSPEIMEIFEKNYK